MEETYYLGIDAGTGSVGWAVTTPDYEVIKRNGKALWGTRLFKTAEPAEKRRMARSARRRNQRKCQRIKLLRELFSDEITKIDPAFYLRLDESKYLSEDKKSQGKFCLFNDPEFNDRDYHALYPTIYHLRKAMMKGSAPKDPRLVYLAVAHILKHRGHFLFHMALDGQPEFAPVWQKFCIDMMELLSVNVSCSVSGFDPDSPESIEKLKDVLSARTSITRKKQLLKEILCFSDEVDLHAEKYIPAILSGGKIDISGLFQIEMEADHKNDLSISLSSGDMDNEEKTEVYRNYLEDRYVILEDLNALFAWGALKGILGNAQSISDAKVKAYEKHREDRIKLRKVLHSEEMKGKISGCFRRAEYNLSNYSAYVGHYEQRFHVKSKKDPEAKRYIHCNRESFYKYLKGLMKGCSLPEAREIEEEMAAGVFMPLQHVPENSLIPFQMHLAELKKILDYAAQFIPFLNEKDEDGYTGREKVESLLTFRVPYYVGPMDNTNAKPGTHWAVKLRPEVPVRPWNFEHVVDQEACAEAFMNQLTNTCTYLIGEPVLPGDSVLYSYFMVLNELNNVTVYGRRLEPALKQKIFTELFMKKAKVRRKDLEKYFVTEGILKREELPEIGGFDGDFKANLKIEQTFEKIFAPATPSVQQMDEMVRAVLLLKQEPKMLHERIGRIVPQATTSQIRRVSEISCEGWGRLSQKFLINLKGILPETGLEPVSILEALWKTQYNLMQLLSAHMPYAKLIEEVNRETSQDLTYDYAAVEKLCASPSVRRSVWQTMKIVEEITHIMGGAPTKFFIEMAKGPDGSGRTKSRKIALQQKYQGILDSMGSWSTEEERDDCKRMQSELATFTDAQLRRDKLYFYFTQMGRCIYTGEKISLEALLADVNSSLYDIDHIYPQSKVKDDSLDNRVLAKKSFNENIKKNIYPVDSETRHNMRGFWQELLNKGLISKIKYDRLSRSSAFSEEELSGFISRQLVETRQSTKALAHILEKAYPDSRIVYSKASNVADFRQVFGNDMSFIKVRDLNDLHHAKDAYLNIVVGNVYDVKFNGDPFRFVRSGEPYSMKPQVLFGDREISRGHITAWKKGTIDVVRKNFRKNNIMVTVMPLTQTSGNNGGFFDNNMVSAKEGLIPIKGDPRMAATEKYGGYNTDTTAYFMLVEHKKGRKRQRTLVPMYLRCVEKAEKTQDGRLQYCREELSPGLVEPEIIIPRILKYTMMEMNGFRFRYTGTTGSQLVAEQVFQLTLPDETAWHLKRVLRMAERITEAQKNNQEIPQVTKFDGVSAESNLALYDIFLQKMGIPMLAGRPAKQDILLQENRNVFIAKPVTEQCLILSQILRLFGRKGAADLSMLNGSKTAGKLQFSMNVSDDFKILYESVTGFYTHEDRRLLK